MEFGPHTVAHEVPHDGATVCFHVLLHRVGDIIDPVAGAGELDALPEALFGHMDQMHGLVAHLSAGEGGGAVAVEAVQKGAHVHADDVALLQLPGTGYTMDDFLVDRDTGGAGETAVAQEGGLGSVALDKLAHGGIDLMGGHAGPHHGAGQRPGLGGQPPGPAHALDFAGRFERDHIHLVHFPSNSMILVFVSSMPPRSGTRLSTPFSS